MTFYLIGLGLNLKSISVEALQEVQKCRQVYLESYTADFPYTKKELELFIKKQIISLNRQEVENENFINDAKKNDVALLVYVDV